MILELRQVENTSVNEYEAYESEHLLCRGQLPWWNRRKGPSADERKRVLSLTGPDGELLLQAEPEGDAYQVTDACGEPAGSFRMSRGDRSGLTWGKVPMQIYDLYDKDREVLVFYVGSVQVGQITRIMASRDAASGYLIHFLPDYDLMAPFLVLFTLCFEHLNHSGNGEDRKDAELMRVFLGEQVKEYYHRDFISTYFGEEENLRVELLLEEAAGEITGKMKNEAIRLGLPMLAGSAVILGILLALVWIAGI